MRCPDRSSRRRFLGKSRGRVDLTAALGVALVAGCTLVHAQAADTPVNFIFATQLGSGIYRAGDQTIQVYRIPGTFTLRPAKGHPFGVALRFAVAVGFYDFELGDVLQGRFPNDVGTLTGMTGVEFALPLAERWELTPFADVGYGVAGALDQSSWVFAAGAESRLRFLPKDWTLLLGNRLAWAGQTAATAGLPDRYVRLDTVFDARHSMPWRWGGHETDLGPFAAVYFYTSATGFAAYPALQDRSSLENASHSERLTQFEVGLTCGPTTRFTVWKIPVPRAGLSYRFGEDGASWRLVLGAPF